MYALSRGSTGYYTELRGQPCSGLKLDVKIKGSICSYLCQECLLILAHLFFLCVKKFYRICHIYLGLKMSYAEAAGAGTE